MSDLFATSTPAAHEPPPLRPPVAHANNHATFESDRPKWLADAAPHCARRILQGNDESIRFAWSHMADDYKAAVWRLLDRAGRKVVRAALDGAGAPADLTQVPA